MSNGITCGSCGRESNGTTADCPSCWAPLRSRAGRRSLALGVALVAMIVLSASLAAVLVGALDALDAARRAGRELVEGDMSAETLATVS